MTEKIKEQILSIRDTGLTNMFDTKTVQCLAFERGFNELVVFIQESNEQYCRFILYGDETEEE